MELKRKLLFFLAFSYSNRQLRITWPSRLSRTVKHLWHWNWQEKLKVSVGLGEILKKNPKKLVLICNVCSESVFPLFWHHILKTWKSCETFNLSCFVVRVLKLYFVVGTIHAATLIIQLFFHMLTHCLCNENNVQVNCCENKLVSHNKNTLDSYLLRCD